MYKFKELNEEAKENAINDYINFLLETTAFEKLHFNSNLYKACKEAEEMRTPWFLPQYIWEYCEKSILKELKRCLYKENGEFIQYIN